MKSEYRKQTKPATPKPTAATASIEKHVVPQLLKTIALLRAELALLKAQLQKIQPTTEAKKIVYKQGIKQ